MSRKNTNQPEYGTELKLVAVRRVLAGESVSAVAQELGIRRKRLYVWKDRYAELGEAGLTHRRGGRPRKVVSEDKDGAETMSGRGTFPSHQRSLQGGRSGTISFPSPLRRSTGWMEGAAKLPHIL